MASLSQYQNKDGRKLWRVRYRKPDGTQTDKRGFARRKDAEAWMAEHVVTALASGTYVDPADGQRTLGSLAEPWLAKKRLVVKPSYIDDLEGAWRKYVQPAFGMVPIATISRAGVQRWVADISQGRFDGSTKSATVVKRAYGILAGILDDAVADRLLGVNPARGVELPRKTRRAHVYLSPAELFALADASGRMRPFVLLLGLTGLRWGEATGLLVSDVDRTRHRIAVTKSATQVGSRVIVGTPKTYEMRSVFYPAMLDPLLPLHGRGADALLFDDPNGLPGGYIRQVGHPRHGSNWFTRACDAAGVERMTVHDLRHTAASLMVSAGASVKSVQRQLGHASAAMTLDVYADLFDSDLDSVAESMESMLQEYDVGRVWAKPAVSVA